MAKTEMRGRRPTFSRQDRDYLADLVRKYGIRGAQRKSTISVCCQTLSKIAEEYGITLKRGKRPRKAA